MSERKEAVEAKLDARPFAGADYALAVQWLSKGDESRWQEVGARIESLVADPTNRLFTITADGEPVGLLGASTNVGLGAAELFIELAPGAQGNGWGRKIGREFVEAFFQSGFTTLTVHCVDQESVNLCSNLGFEPLEVTPMMLTKDRWDSLVGNSEA